MFFAVLKMNDIYEVISDYELEEGEITDDDDDCVVTQIIPNNAIRKDERSLLSYTDSKRASNNSSFCSLPEKKCLQSKEKILPRRYSSVSQTNTRGSNHKRKKRRSHHKKKLIHKINCNSLKCDITLQSSKNKSAFRNYSSPPREALTSVDKDDKKFPVSVETVSRTINSKNDNQKVVPSICNENNSQSSVTNISQLTNGKEDNSDDEEELRRIALSSIAKRNKVMLVSKTENILKSTDDYEVIDMEVDTVECLKNDNLDSEKSLAKEEIGPSTMHSVENLVLKLAGAAKVDNVMSCDPNTDNSPPCDNQELGYNLEKSTSSRNSNEEFEEQLLRAELISSMIARKKENMPLGVLQKVVPELPSLNSKKPKIFRRDVKDLKSSTYSKSPLVKYANFSLKRAVNNANIGQSKFKSRFRLRSMPETTAKPSPEKVVINLNNESSSEESEEECSIESSEASIHALIFNARQESDSGNSFLNDNKNVSKAEQEEFNSLQKILAEKDKIADYEPVQNQTNQYSNVNILSKKITKAANDLINEVKMMNNIQNELFSKKQIYMSSKLKVQHLKEQLHSAETLRTLNLESWKKCAAKLDVLKQSVLQRENLITLLRTQLNNVTYKAESNS